MPAAADEEKPAQTTPTTTAPLNYAAPGRNESPVAARAASGFAWLTVQTLAAKALSFVGQIALAYFLAPEHFGIVGLALTVSAFVTLFQQAGLREILIFRHRHYARWANPAFWMAASLGLAAAAVLLVAAPIAAWAYHEPRVIGLLVVLAIAAPISGLDAVPEARLQAQMRFRLLASTNLAVAVAQLILSLCFAKLGLGAYSFVLPRPITALIRLLVLWNAARPPVRMGPQVRRWKYLVGDSATLLAANVIDMLTWQGDYMLLGWLHETNVVGLYYFAFNLSIQTMQLFAANLSGVLFPALSQFQDDPVRQTRAFLTAARVLAIVAVPLCFLQASVAHPLVHALFKPRWYEAIPVLQILSLGMAFRVVASPGGSLMSAQGRFRATLVISVVNAAMFMLLVYAGASWKTGAAAATSTAVAVAIYYVIAGPSFLAVALWPGRVRFREIFNLYWPSFAAAILATALAWLADRSFLAGRDPELLPRAQHLIRIILVVCTTTAIYVPLVRWFDRDAWRDLVAHTERFTRRRRPRPGAAARVNVAT